MIIFPVHHLPVSLVNGDDAVQRYECAEKITLCGMNPKDGDSKLLQNVSKYLIYHENLRFPLQCYWRSRSSWMWWAALTQWQNQCHVTDNTNHQLLTSVRDTTLQKRWTYINITVKTSRLARGAAFSSEI